MHLDALFQYPLLLLKVYRWALRVIDIAKMAFYLLVHSVVHLNVTILALFLTITLFSVVQAGHQGHVQLLMSHISPAIKPEGDFRRDICLSEITNMLWWRLRTLLHMRN